MNSVYKTNSTGVVDWSQTSYSDSIANFETQFGEDLDGDESVGIDISSISLKTSDTKGVLDGDLADFMAATLAMNVSGKSRAEAKDND